MALQTKSYEVHSNTFTLELTLVENSTSQSGNTSSVSYTLKLISTTKNFAQYGVGAKVELDGKTVAERDRGTAPKITLGTYSEVTLLSGTATIGHNSDGSKSMSFAYSLDMATASYTPGPMNGSGSMTLTKIPRGATITSAPNFTDEDNPVVKFSNPGGATVEVCIKTEDESSFLVAYKSASGASYTFSFTQSEREALQAYATKNTATVTFVIRSVLYGQTYFSTAEKTLTIKNPAPTLAPVIEDVNDLTVALTGDPGVLVRYASNAKVVTGAKAVKQSKLVSVKVTCGSKSLSGDGVLSGVEFGSFVISATDSRGNTTTQTVKKQLIEYFKPTCYIGEGVPNSDGDFVFSTSGAAFNGDFGAEVNLLTAEYRYRLKGGDWGAWSPMDVQTNGTSYTASTRLTVPNYQDTYEFQGRITDKITTAESTSRLVTSIPTYDWNDKDFNFNVEVFLTSHYADGTSSVRSLSRCGATASMSVSAGSISSSQEIPLGKTVYAYGGAEVTDGGIKVANTGVYLVTGVIHYTGGVTNSWNAVGVDVAGKSYTAAYSTLSNGNGTAHSPGMLLPISAGEVVKLRAYPSSGAISVNRDDRTSLTVTQVY